jgi:protein-ribulosamine 3-kinase
MEPCFVPCTTSNFQGLHSSPWSDRARSHMHPSPRAHTPRRSARLARMQVRQDFGTAASDEIAEYISTSLELGKVDSMRRAGSSGWAIMHKAVTDRGARLFIKVSRGDESMFAGEAEGLRTMFETNTLRVPEVYHYGPLESGKGSFIIMEELDLGHIVSQSRLGRALAEMHLADPLALEAKEGKFGFTIDNTIGETLQPNGWMDNWVDFFRERRLRHQLLLTGDSDLIRRGNKLCEKLDTYFKDVEEIKPTILHGDLWSGNINSVNGTPVVFDPACYYGHHEAEFGMSWCAGFTKNFWEAYHEVIPRAPGFGDRRLIYELYHYLNHYNLFGGGYRAMAESILHRLID